MFFNSIEFGFFLPIVFILYWFIFNKNIKSQNLLVLVASYIFYGWWDWRFLSLIIFSSVIDYYVGIKLSTEENKEKRKKFLYLSLFVNIGTLITFKYFNFFINNFIDTFSFFGMEISGYSINLVLPVGISFYTFQTLSYSIDVYKRNLEPTKDIVAFFAYVSFFPQLVAGPIERATNLLPQFSRERKFNYDKASDGLRQILWGLFKKVVIADSCANYVNLVFDNYADYNGSALLVGAILFAFQIYGDFSGYSDIAIGVSKLFGFNLMQNFAFPYFSRDIAEFWRRWHISLSTWFRDYLYIPLGGSRGSLTKKMRNTFAIFIVSGFWHGANWTFIFWGFLNALYFLPLMLLNKNRVNRNVVAESKIIPTLREFFQMLITFSLTTLAWIFFRSQDIFSALEYIERIFSNSLFLSIDLGIKNLFFIIIPFIIIEWFNRNKLYGLEKIKLLPKYVRWPFYLLIVFFIIHFMTVHKSNEFIYFQF